MKQTIIKAAASAGERHIPSAFSVLYVIWVLYDRVLQIGPQNPRSDGRDRSVLSKGHGALTPYAVLAEKGFFLASELERFAAFDSPLGGHPDGMLC